MLRDKNIHSICIYFRITSNAKIILFVELEKTTKEKDVKDRRTHRQTKQQDTGIKKNGKGLNNCIHCKKEK